MCGSDGKVVFYDLSICHVGELSIKQWVGVLICAALMGMASFERSVMDVYSREGLMGIDLDMLSV